MKKVVALLISVMVFFSVIDFPVMAATDGITKEQSEKIVNRCIAIKGDLVDLQHRDARAWDHLSHYYEKVLISYITPLNVALISNGISNIELVENQSVFTEFKTKFTSDYVAYQKSLEKLVAIDCKSEPEVFYKKLGDTRLGRKKVADDVTKLRGLMATQVTLVEGLKENL